jgi:hypothetical protein
MAAAPFGFSVGDFIAAIELTHKAAKALRNTSGASGQYQQALLDLELIGSVLRRVQGLTPASASHETIRAIQLCGLACQVPLEHFLHKIKKLEPHLNFDQTSSSAEFLNVKKSTTKLRWAIVLEQDVAKLKASIGPGIEIINTLLQLESLERSTTTQRCAEQILDQTGRVLPVVEQISTFLQSNIATKQHVQDVLPVLVQLKYGLSQAATAQQVQSLASALTGLSGRLDDTATKDQTNGLATLIEDIKRTAESSNLMLMTLIDRIPNISGRDVQAPKRIRSTATSISKDLHQPQRSSGMKLSRRISPNTAWRCLLKALRRALGGILLFFLWLNPAFQLCLRSMNTLLRSPTILLDNNITFVDALNREFSLPYQQFRYWPVLSAFIQCQFRDCPGTLRIAHNKFAVFKEMKSSGRGVMIPFDEWEQLVRPGQCVLMSMYIGQEQSTRGHQPIRSVCRSCGLKDSSLLDGSIWTKWQVNHYTSFDTIV